MSAAAAGGTPIGVDPVAPVLVQVVRGEIVEAQHRGDVVIVGDGGVVRAALGASDRLISLRSAIKPFTAVAVLMAVESSGGEVSSDTHSQRLKWDPAAAHVLWPAPLSAHAREGARC